MTVQDVARIPFTGRSRTEGPKSDPTIDSRWWQAMEAGITGTILLLLVLTVTDSIVNADWVREMPDLRRTGLLALAVGAVLATRRLRWYVALLAGIALGFVVFLWQVLGVESLGGQPVFFDRFEDLYFRIEDWFRQAFNNGITTDNLPFVAFTTGGIFLAVLLSTWTVLRWRNPWPAVVVLGAILAVNVSYLEDRQWNLSFGFFATGAALLLMRTALLRRMDGWRANGTQFPTFISLSFVAVTLVATVLLLGLSRGLPRPDESSALTSAWDSIADPFNGLNDDFRRIFGGIDSNRGVPVHAFDDFFVLQGDISPGEGIVLRAAAPEPGLLRGASYDRYGGRGWQQSDLDQRAVPDNIPIPEAAGSDAAPYRDRREVTVRLAVERSPAVLFSFGVPEQIDKDTRVEELAPTITQIDLTADPRAFARSDLGEALAEIRERAGSEDGITTAGAVALVPSQYDVLDVDPPEPGAQPTSITLASSPSLPDVLSVRGPDRLRAGFTYDVTGTVSTASAESLRDAGTAYPLWVLGRFLQLPRSLTDDEFGRLRELARQVVAGADTPYDAAVALENYLCCSVLIDDAGAPLIDEAGLPRLLYPFTTDIDLPPPQADSVSWFLFENVDADNLPVGGYYDYHASAMAVLLRSIGIPARVATGFAIGDQNYDGRTDNYIIRGRDAYTWVEVFFPEYGWVDFDPTPPDPEVRQIFAAGGEVAPARIARQRISLVDETFATGDEGLFLDEFLEEFLEDFAPDSRLPEGATARTTGSNWWYLWAPLIALGAITAMSASGALAWHLSFRGLGPAERGWRSTERLARWSGLRVPPSATAVEHATQIDGALATPGIARRIADAYGAVRFGRKELSPDQYDEVRSAWRDVRGRFVRRILHLPQPNRDDLWAPPALSVDEDGAEDADISDAESTES